MTSMASLIENYKNGMSLKNAIDQFLEHNPTHELVVGMHQIQMRSNDASVNTNNIDDFISKINQINFRAYEVEEQILFLRCLCQFFIDCNRISNAKSIYSVINKLIAPNLAPEFQILPIAIQAELSKLEGNFKKKIELTKNCLDLLNPTSGRYNYLLWAYTSQLGLTGDFENFNKYFQLLKQNSQNTKFASRIDYILMVQSLETGNFKIIKSLADKIRNDQSVESRTMDITVCEKIYRIFVENNHSGLDENFIFDRILLSTSCLLNNDYQNALEWARKCSEKYVDFLMEPSFFSYYQIRAELANGNISTAEYSLEKRKKMNNSCVFDDYFWFRIFHIKGNKEKAQYFLNLFLENSDKFDLHKRLDVEFRLSPEISLSVFRSYTRILEKPIILNSSHSPTNKKEITNELDFIIGSSKAINQVKELIKKFSNVDTSILIVGETGTGKELVARALWKSGNYHSKPFIATNCGAISDHLLQSELFGHKKGAFTGAYENHDGIFEEAKDGVVFLDEIGEISNTMQISLLRVLESKEYRSVGANETKKIRCKIITATNKNLSELVKNKVFREDLLFRLERLIIEIPPLRKRPEDIPILVDYFLNTINPDLPPIHFEKTALDLLMSLPWEGNVRELRNEMERIRLFYSDKKVLTITELSQKYRLKNTNSVQDLDDQKVQLNSTESSININSKFRRIEELKNLFTKYEKLTRLEVVDLLKVSPNTAANYLETLEKESVIVKKNIPNTKTYFFTKINSQN